MSVPPIAPPFSSSGTGAINEAAPIEEYEIERLLQQGYTRGLAMSLNDAKKSFFKRIWIVDNSGSMQTTDGNKLVATGKQANQMKMVQCSRWEEIQECVGYHIQLAAAMKAPTTFRLLNRPGPAEQQKSVASSPNDHDMVANETRQSLEWIQKVRPGGCTPLTQHILEIQQEVASLVPTLTSTGQRVVLVLATDGLPTDSAGYGGPACQQEFVSSLRRLEGLPIWMIIRLCTDEQPVVDFYSELDKQLELSIEVLDDFSNEAAEIQQHNPWLTYGLPIHRMRELGYHDRVFDLLDERPLTTAEMRDFLRLLLGDLDGVPDPSVDWSGFFQHVKRLVEKEKETWNPIVKRTEQWISLSTLNTIYGDGSDSRCAIM